jgi:multicomponent Na+:H+ antiporter subunit G
MSADLGAYLGLALDVLSWILLVAGGLACVIGGLGLLRMPDFYTRVHAASVSDAVGAGLILAGLLLQAESVLVALKLFVVGLLIFFTSPAATHALARAALDRGLEPWRAPWKR